MKTFPEQVADLTLLEPFASMTEDQQAKAMGIVFIRNHPVNASSQMATLATIIHKLLPVASLRASHNDCPDGLTLKEQVLMNGHLLLKDVIKNLETDPQFAHLEHLNTLINRGDQ